MANVFLILGIALISATLIGYFSKALRQPLILAYLITGFILGPAVLGLVQDIETVQLLSEMGITFLLFTVGLHLNPENLKELGFVSVITGIGQVVVMTLAGMLIGTYFGFSPLASFYIGISIALSSTIIIVKMLSEKGDLNSLHGRISIGFLLVQDFVAVIALVLASGTDTTGGLLSSLGITIIKATAFISLVAVVSKYFLQPLFDKVAQDQELLFMSSISYCFLLAIGSYQLGLSVEVGAFLAGISLATLPYNLHIENKIRPLRDFFVVMFFITLGTEMGFALGDDIMMPLIALSLLVLIGTPLMIMISMGAMGYRKRTSFMVGLTVSQISEFSLILVALGHKVGHIGNEVVSLVTGVGVITITVSAYLIMYGHQIYNKVQHYLDIFERDESIEIDNVDEADLEDHIVVVGYHRVGYGIVNQLREMGKDVLVVDFDPKVIKQLADEGIPCIYGDVADPKIVEKMNIEDAEIVISTDPDVEDNLEMMRKANEINPGVMVMIVAEHVEEALKLYDEGADYVILPHLLGGEHASLMLEEISTDVDKLIEKKLEHVEELKKRKELHPHHTYRKSGP